MKKFRLALLSALATLLAVPAAAGIASPAHAAATTSFTLNGTVIDGGQQVVSVTLETTKYHINPQSLSVNTFQVHATGTNPYSSLDPATVFGTYDKDRTVTGVKLNANGDIVISLFSGEDAPAAFTFAWANSVGRNIMLDLKYTITQRLPVKAAGRNLTFGAFTQGALVDREVDAYASGKSASGLNYRIFQPANARKSNLRPLIVWLHGGGEGGWAQAQNNDLPLIANRGALGFSTASAQTIFKGAYVVAPQATDRWMNDLAMGYTAKLKSLIDEIVRQYPIDKHRIYVTGASNGGYMTLKLESAYPRFFAAGVPTCPGVKTFLTDAQLLKVRSTPTWIVQARNDTTLPFVDNGLHAYNVIGNAHLTAYPDVVWAGHTFAGHWSWIYVAHNDPTLKNGTHLYQWMARQHR